MTYKDERAEELRQLLEAITTTQQADDFDPESEPYLDMKQRSEMLRKQIDAMVDIEQRSIDHQALMQRSRPMATTRDQVDDLGDTVVRSPAWKAYLRNGAGGRAQLADVPLNRRALITTSWFPGQDSRIVANPPAQATPLLDVLSNVQVSSGSVEIVTYQAAPPIAGAVAEGAQKPEATITTSVVPVTLDTLAHWIEATRQSIQDEAMVRDLISGGLLRGVYAKAEADAAVTIIGGSYGTAIAGADMLQSIRMAVADVQMAGFTPNAALINPIDAAELDFAIWALNGNITVNGSVFGVRVVPVSNITPGTAYVGDFNNGVKWLYMGAAQLYVSDSDVGMVAAAPVSNFKRNVLTFLAEMRATTAIVQAAAIRECTPVPGAVTRTARPATEPEQSRRGEKK